MTGSNSVVAGQHHANFSGAIRAARANVLSAMLDAAIE